MLVPEYVYFTLYNHYNQRSYFPDALFTRLQTMYMVSVSAGGWILLLQAAYLRIFKQSWFSNQSGAMFFAMSVYALMALVLHRVFITNNRDQKIQSRYADKWEANPNKKRDLVLSFIALSMPYILLLVLKIAIPRTN